MSKLSVMDRIRTLELDRFLGLRPSYPSVVLQVDREVQLLVRTKPQRGKSPLLEAHRSCPIPPDSVPSSIFEAGNPPAKELAQGFGKLFETTGTKPGRVSLVIPDNLAKITLLQLPERPASRKQLDELVHARMRKAVPFKLEDARLSYQLLSGEGPSVSILIVLVRRALIESYERAIVACGAMVGLVDLCTPNLLNLCRAQVEQAASEGDVAVLNCTPRYFSLAIVRNSRLIFLRCKTHVGEVSASNGALAREIANSFSYYEEKLRGTGVRTIFVRSVAVSVEEIAQRLSSLEIPRIEAIDAVKSLELPAATIIDTELGQRLAPAIGAVIGR